MRQKLMTLVCAAALAVTACGDDEAASPGAVYIGTWATTAGSQEVFGCLAAFTKKSENLAITYTIEKGDGADLVLTSSLAPDCKLKANVAGTRATVVENQTCTRPDGKYEDTYRYATTSGFDMPASGPATIKLEATFKRALEGTDTGYECGFTEESTVTKK